MRYYGIQHTYGANVIDGDGDRIGNYHAFARKTERDEWVEEGNPYFTQGGARDAIPASDPELRRLLRRDDARYYVQEHGPQDAERAVFEREPL